MSPSYSKTPLAKKLGIKAGDAILHHNCPKSYFSLFDVLPEDISVNEHFTSESIDFIHAFFTSITELEQDYSKLKLCLKKSGMFWISWPKGSSNIYTDLKRDWIRDYALSRGLVDVKIASIDENWSALKFVYRLVDR